MANDEQDRFGDKLRQKEKADEDRFFAERDKALVEKLRKQLSAAEIEQVRNLVRTRCPQCSEHLVTVEEHGVTVAECPTGHGLWVDHHQLETIAKRERDSWLGRFFYRPKR